MERTQPDLTEAARVGNIDALYASIRSVPRILDKIDRIPFVNTPLHEAAAAGQTCFALEILSLKPSFGRKLNPDGLSPLHLALQNGHSETVKRLIKFDSELIRVKGRERITPLHYVAGTDDIDLLAEFLCACPASIEDLTIREETAIHVAAKRRNPGAFNVILQWLLKRYNTRALKWKDQEGNTLLHIAVSTNQPEIVRLLVNKKHVFINEKNLEGMTALDIATRLFADGEEIMKSLRRAKASKASSLSRDDGTLAGFLVSPWQFLEQMFGFFLNCQRELSMDMRNTVLVVAVLIATATFQAVLSPPGGFSVKDVYDEYSSSPRYGTPPSKPLSQLPRKVWVAYNTIFFEFYLCNTWAFTASVMVIISVLPLRPYSFVLHASLVFIAISYGLAIFSLSPSRVFAWILTPASLALPFMGYFFKITFAVVKREIKLEVAEIWSWLTLRGWKCSFSSTRRLRMVHRVVGVPEA